MNFLELMATLSLDKKDYDTGLDDASDKANSFSKTMGNVAKVMGGAVVAGIGAATTATIAGTKAFIDGVSSVSQYADNIDKMSQKMNMSATAYQEWDFIMQHAGTSIESMQAGIKTLSSAAETGNEAFQKLGMTEEQVASMSGEELFAATISALQNVSDETERTYLAGQLLGRGATELGALLNMSAEETEEMKNQAHELGGVLSDEAVKSGAQFQDSLQNMQTAFNGLKNSMLSQFLPSFSTVMDGLSAIFSGDTEGGLGMIKEGVGDLADKIAEVAPTFIEVGGTILSALASSIAQNAPVLIKAGGEAISTLIEGIIDNADSIFAAAEQVINLFVNKLVDPEKAAKFTQVAINLIIKLADALTQALPQLLPAIAGVIAEIVRTLTQPDNLSALIQCALQLIMALAMGIVDAIPEIVSVIPEIVVNIITALVENTPLILETLLELIGAIGMAVFNLIGGLLGMDADEIKESITLVFDSLAQWGADVLQWISNVGTNIKNGITSFFTNAYNFFANGIDNIKTKVTEGLDNIKSKFTSIFDNVKNVVHNAIEFIKGLFKFDWELPPIKLPHFSISGQLDLLATPPTFPTVSIEWYKKAMNAPYLLDRASIFGVSGGKLLGAGESGRELVYGHEQLLSDIGQVVDNKIRSLELVAPIYIGGRKIDQQIVTANAKHAHTSGGW